jgi:hypothetical protein
VLGDYPPLFDQLQKCLAAVAQALAFLERVDSGDSVPWQLKQHFLNAFFSAAPTIEASFFSRR